MYELYIQYDFGGSIPNVTVHVSYVYNSLLLPYTTAQCVLPKLSRSTGRNWIGQYLWDTLCSVFPDDVRLPVQDLLQLKVSKFRKQIFQPKLLPKNKPTKLFFYPDYLSGYKNKFDGSVFGKSFGWKICFRFLLTFNRHYAVVWMLTPV